MSLTLVELSSEDFARRRALVVAGLTEAIRTARRLTAAEARAEAERDVAERLPRGPATPGQLLRTALSDGTEVGWIWVSLPGTTVPDLAWICDVEVDPEFRSRGYAGAIITAAEAELAGLGVPRIGLNVFGDNDTARRLYKRLGYEVYAQQRSRSLTRVPASGGIELVPMADYESRIEELFAGYAQTLVQEQGLWHGEAETRAARKLAELLPHGTRTEGMILRTVAADGVPVGWVWAGLPAPPRPGLGWLHHLEIDEPHRSRGYGRAAVAAIEAELVRRGVASLGLHVDGSDLGARRFADRLGYRLLAQQMAKDL
jgi:ribosomal protein S18 acetylase RimI-like enzyme